MGPAMIYRAGLIAAAVICVACFAIIVTLTVVQAYGPLYYTLAVLMALSGPTCIGLLMWDYPYHPSGSYPSNRT